MTNQTSNQSYGREDLKKFFVNGSLPSESHFGNLIDSTINKEDDGFAKDEPNGLHLSPQGSSKRLVTYYNSVDELTPLFYVDKYSQEKGGLQMQSAQIPDGLSAEENSFFFQSGGKLGIGKRSDPKYKLDVKGWVGMEGRIGTFGSGPGYVPADGKWHPIIQNLDNCQAFEIIARAGKKGSGKFAILHAIALSAYGRSRSKIRKTSAHYGFFWNTLSLRWKGSTHDYALELRSNNNFGDGIQIYYNITRLWDDAEALLPAQYFYSPNTDE